MRRFGRLFFFLAITLAVAAVPASAVAVTPITLDGDLGSVNYQVRRSVAGRISVVAHDVVRQQASPNTTIDVIENGATNTIGIFTNVADKVFLDSLGDVLVQGNSTLGQITNGEVGVIILGGDLVYTPGVVSFVSGTGTALLFAYTADIKTVAREDRLSGLITMGTAKIKISPGMVEVVTVDATAGPVTVASVRGTGLPAYLIIRLPALKFWEVVR